ncbi:MAG: hypothetical protein Tsb0015_16640 [Simkaniaceae bacterium]
MALLRFETRDCNLIFDLAQQIKTIFRKSLNKLLMRGLDGSHGLKLYMTGNSWEWSDVADIFHAGNKLD